MFSLVCSVGVIVLVEVIYIYIFFAKASSVMIFKEMAVPIAATDDALICD